MLGWFLTGFFGFFGGLVLLVTTLILVGRGKGDYHKALEQSIQADIQARKNNRVHQPLEDFFPAKFQKTWLTQRLLRSLEKAYINAFEQAIQNVAKERSIAQDIHQIEEERKTRKDVIRALEQGETP